MMSCENTHNLNRMAQIDADVVLGGILLARRTRGCHILNEHLCVNTTS